MERNQLNQAAVLKLGMWMSMHRDTHRTLTPEELAKAAGEIIGGTVTVANVRSIYRSLEIPWSDLKGTQQPSAAKQLSERLASVETVVRSIDHTLDQHVDQFSAMKSRMTEQTQLIQRLETRIAVLEGKG